MEIGTIIAVGGTLIGVVISGIMTSMIQQRNAERQRMWRLEDENRNIERENEIDKKNLIRERISRRMQIVEELVGLMASVMGSAEGRMLGLSSEMDKELIKKMNDRIDQINSDAYRAVMLSGSEELEDNWKIIATNYWHGLRETGEVDLNTLGDVQKAEVEIIKIIDGLVTTSK